jgi:hypothetical protein
MSFTTSASRLIFITGKLFKAYPVSINNNFSIFNPMKTLLIFCLLLVCATGKAQDTIYKRNKEVISAKIAEISSTEVKYKRFAMQDGPLFVIGRDEVQKIKFANGAVDSFAVTQPVVAQPTAPSQPSVVYQSTPLLTGLIQNPRPGSYYFNQARINEKKLLFIATDKNRAWKDKELTNAIIATRDYKNNQYISGFGGPVVLLACFIGAGQTLKNGGSDAVVSALVVNGIGILIASQIISPMFKRKRAKSARKVLELYNLHVQK